MSTFPTTEEVLNALRMRTPVPDGRGLSVRDASLYVIEDALDAIRYAPDPRSTQIVRLKRLLVDHFVKNPAVYAFNEGGLPAYKKTFETELDMLFVRAGFVNRQASSGLTALQTMLASCDAPGSGQCLIGRAKFLLVHHADVDIESEQMADFMRSLALLRHADDGANNARTMRTYVDVLRMLLERGASLDDCQHVFINVVQNPLATEAVRIMINHGIDVNKKDYLKDVNGCNDFNASPLYAACYGNCGNASADIVRLLLASGAKLADDEANDIMFTIAEDVPGGFRPDRQIANELDLLLTCGANPRATIAYKWPNRHDESNFSVFARAIVNCKQFAQMLETYSRHGYTDTQLAEMINHVDMEGHNLLTDAIELLNDEGSDQSPDPFLRVKRLLDFGQLLNLSVLDGGDQPLLDCIADERVLDMIDDILGHRRPRPPLATSESSDEEVDIEADVVPSARLRTNEDVIRDYMRAKHIWPSLSGNITNDIMYLVARRAGIRGWVKGGVVVDSVAYIANALRERGL